MLKTEDVLGQSNSDSQQSSTFLISVIVYARYLLRVWCRYGMEMAIYYHLYSYSQTAAHFSDQWHPLPQGSHEAHLETVWYI